MPLFASFEPDPIQIAAPLPISIRYARLADIAEIARLTFQRHGGDPLFHVRNIESMLVAGHVKVMVAEYLGKTIAFGKHSRIDPPENHPLNSVPRGWYLVGLIVDEEFRRRGIGKALTRHRMEHLFRETEEIFYFANENNRVSIALHQLFGFVEVDRDIWVPGVTFSEGVGVLFCATKGRVGRGGFPPRPPTDPDVRD